jgi:deoxycytidine triphosphate deaminase
MIAAMEMRMAQPKLFNELPEGSRILLAADIRNLVHSHGLIAPFDPEENLASTTYDLTAGAKALLVGVDHADERAIRPESALTLEPGAYVGIISREKVQIPPNILVHLGPKKRLAYEGIILLSGSVIHPGYEGHCLFVLFNSSGSNRVIGLGRKICAAVFYQLDREVPKEELQEADRGLLAGNFPTDFQNAMANMKLPSLIEVTKKLKDMTLLDSRIRELEREFTDVRVPIRELGEYVKDVAKDVKTLAAEGKEVLGKIKEHDTTLQSISKTIAKHGVWIVVFWMIIAVPLAMLVWDAIKARLAAPQPQAQVQPLAQPPPQPPAQSPPP